METQVDSRVEEAQVRRLIEDWTKAARDKDIDGLMACYAPDIVSFDMIPPLQYVGGRCVPQGLAAGVRDVPGSG